MFDSDLDHDHPIDHSASHRPTHLTIHPPSTLNIYGTHFSRFRYSPPSASKCSNTSKGILVISKNPSPDRKTESTPKWRASSSKSTISWRTIGCPYWLSWIEFISSTSPNTLTSNHKYSKLTDSKIKSKASLLSKRLLTCLGLKRKI